MSSVTQPDVTNDAGVTLTVGIVSGFDRCAIVMPLATDASSLDAITLANDAVLSFAGSPLTQLLDCIAENSHVSFIQAEPMVDGKVPFRTDFSPTDHPGTRSTGPITSQVSGLIVFYRDPTSVVGTPETRVGKNFIPGIAANDVAGDIISSDLHANLQNLADTLQNGFASSGGGGSTKWYRYLATPVPRTAGTHLKTTTAQQARFYTATQRRRLIPH